jgi:subtilisin-like proprotein convertase family protein
MKKILLLFGVFVFSYSTCAQLTVSNGYTAAELGTVLSGPNVTVTNATITGNALQYGQFNYAGVGFPMEEGIILSTGSIFDAPGPNSSGSTTGGMGGPGSPLLTAISGQPTNDAVVLQFDFFVVSDNIQFDYIFCSEEYNEFVGSINDAFGFFISGPGIVGQENIALVPGTTTPVSINTINLGSYWQFYNNNDGGTTNIEYDGYTTTMTAQKTGLTPCQTYTLTIVIADASDAAWDSGVFLKANSLIQQNVAAESNSVNVNGIALEGCVQSSFTFELDTSYAINTNIPIILGGTAIEGVDYQNLDAVVVIPAGQTSATIYIDALADGLTEGQESIALIYQSEPCGVYDTVMLYIDDYTPMTYTSTGTDPSCAGLSDGQIVFGVAGGAPPFNYMLTDSATNITTTYTTSPVTGLGEGTYYIEIADAYGCQAQDVVSGSLFSGGPVFLPDGNGNAYTNTLNITGFGAGATLNSINQLQSICMNIEHSRLHELEILLEAPDGTTITLKQQPGGGFTNLGEPQALNPSDVGNTDVTPGVGYDYCFTATPDYGTMVAESGNYNYTYTTVLGGSQTDDYLPAGSYQSYDPLTDLIGVPLNGNWTLIIEDHVTWNNGYLFNWSVSLQADVADSLVVLSDPAAPTISHSATQPSCGMSNGSIDLTVTGGAGPFTYDWSSGQITQDVNSMPAGNHTVTVTDVNGCDHDYIVSLSNSSGVSLSASVTDQSCPSTSTGAIDITPTGGTPSYSYLWSTGAISQDVSGLAPGTYTVQVTDGATCITASSYTVAPASPMLITGSATNEFCSDQEGEINISVSGGAGGYLYTWSNSATTQDLTDLASGSYTVTVTDANLCTQAATFSVINVVGSCTPDCDLAFTSANAIDENCGQQNGAITVNFATSNSPVDILWSTGATNSTISGLAAGTYSVTISDAEGCSINQSFELANITGTLAISGSAVTNEACGNSQGAVDISVTGGAMPYSYLWSNAATTQDITGIAAGVYSVTVADANGCELSQNFTVVNNSGTLVQTWGNVVDVVCDEPIGSIDIAISGGNPPYTYDWSNGASSQDLINLGPGTYSCQITDQSGCIINTPVYTVQNLPGTLTITNINSDNEVCGNGQGEILITVSGGALPYGYDWSTGESSQNITGLSAGIYSCAVVDNNGCIVDSGPITIINESGSLNLAGITAFNEVCTSGDGSVNIEVTGGNTPYNYMWNTLSTSEDLTSLSAGNYSCVVTDANGCEITANATVVNSAGTLAIANAIVTNENCGDGTGAINVLVSGGTMPFNYTWSNGSITEDLSGINAGNYNLTVTDADGCLTTATASVLNNSGTFNSTLISVSNEICGDSNGSIDISVSGGTPPYTYTWSNAANTQDISGLSAGSFSCLITDANGCMLNAGPVEVNNGAGTLAISSSSVTAENCNTSNGAVNITVSGGSPGYSYSWSNGPVTEDISGLANGTYTVTITDLGGCELVQAFAVNDNPGSLAITAIAVDDETCNDNGGAIDITVSGGTIPYSYSWSSGQISQDINLLNSGTYSVTVTDVSGCTVTAGPLTVNNNPGNFTLTSISSTDETCGDGTGSINVTVTAGTSPISYLWSTGSTAQDISGLDAGIYSASATDNNGCVLNYTVVVNNDPGSLNLTPAAAITSSTCAGNNGAIDLNVSGGSGYMYTWSNGSSTEDITGLAAGTYTVNVSDLSGCIISETYSVSGSGGNPAITGTTITDDICNSITGEISVSVSGGTAPYDYDWDIASACCSYTLTMNDWGADDWGAAVLNIYINSTLYGSFSGTGWTTVETIPVCSGDVIEVEYQEDGTSDWENSYSITYGTTTIYSDGNPPADGIVYTGTAMCSGPTGQGTNTLSGLAEGTYAVTVTDANGCETTSDIMVGNSGGTTYVSNSLITDDNCGAGIGAINITVATANGPLQYDWSNGPITQDISSLTAGTYTVTISDASGCDFDEVYTVLNQTGGFQVDNAVITDTYCGDASGAIDIAVSGGSIPYTFDWSNGATSEDISGVISGTYSVTISDNSGCEFTENFTINNATNGLAETHAVTPEVCDTDNGAIDMTITGGVSPYSILWSTSDITEDLSGLDAGSYSFTITDNSGCQILGIIDVPADNGSINIQLDGLADDNCSASQGYIMIDVTGGSGTYTYDWSHGETAQDAFFLTEGTYTVTVTDDNGCSAQETYTIDNSTAYTIVDPAVITPASCATCADGAIDISIDWGPNPPGNLTYWWSNGEFTQDISNLTPGTYDVQIWDDFGCYVTGTYTVVNSAGYDDNEMTGIVIYPNPSDGLVYVEFEDPGIDYSLTVVDASGRKVVYTSIITPDKRVQLNLSVLATGTYFIRLTSEKEQIIKPVIITRR